MLILNNPLDWIMYRYCGQEVTAANFPEWDLPRPKPLVDWFTPDEFVDYLQVIE